MQIEPVHIAVASVVIPLAGLAFKMSVRWAVNGTYVRKDLFNARMDALAKDIEHVQETTERIMSHLLAR